MCVWSPGGWSVWGKWVECSSQCGGGIQTRTRTCQSPPEESYLCEGVVEEGRPCNPQPCTGKIWRTTHSFRFLLYACYTWWIYVYMCTCALRYVLSVWLPVVWTWSAWFRFDLDVTHKLDWTYSWKTCISTLKPLLVISSNQRLNIVQILCL